MPARRSISCHQVSASRLVAACTSRESRGTIHPCRRSQKRRSFRCRLSAANCTIESSSATRRTKSVPWIPMATTSCNDLKSSIARRQVLLMNSLITCLNGIFVSNEAVNIRRAWIRVFRVRENNFPTFDFQVFRRKEKQQFIICMINKMGWFGMWCHKKSHFDENLIRFSLIEAVFLAMQLLKQQLMTLAPNLNVVT